MQNMEHKTKLEVEGVACNLKAIGEFMIVMDSDQLPKDSYAAIGEKLINEGKKLQAILKA